ncbi:WD40 repeat domain-containing protein, partial [Candidatus Poribacteria bacterium]
MRNRRSAILAITILVWLCCNRALALPENATRLGYGTVSMADRSIAFSPDGTMLATATTIGICLHDLSTRLLVTILESDTRIYSIAFSPDGRLIASGNWDGTISLWDILSRRMVWTIQRHSSRVNCVAFSPDGTILASGSNDDGDAIAYTDISNRKALTTVFWGHASPPKSVSFSPDGELLASGTDDGRVVLWEVPTSHVVRSSYGIYGTVNSVAFSPDGRLLAIGTDEHGLRLWDLDSHEIVTLGGHSDTVNSVAFGPDGNFLACGTSNNTIELWDIVGRDLITTFAGHPTAVNSVAFSPDGSSIASGSIGTVKLWNVLTLRELETLSGFSDIIMSIAFSPDGSFLASGTDKNGIKLWDMASHKPIAILSGHSDTVNSVAFSPDGRILASGSSDHTIKLWEIPSGQLIENFMDHSSSVNSVAFSPIADGNLLASGSSDHTIKLWDIDNLELMETLTDHSARVNMVDFGPEGNVLVSSSNDNTVRLWDIAQLQVITEIRQTKDRVGPIAFSPSGNLLAGGSIGVDVGADHYVVWLWNAFSGEHVATLARHGHYVNSLDFSPDGNLLASGSSDSKIKVWDAPGHRLLTTLTGHLFSVNSVAFSPVGSILASGGYDGTILLWDMVPYAPKNHKPSLNFSPPPPYSVATGSSIDITVSADDEDGDAVMITADKLPDNAVFEDNKLRISPSMNQIGEHIITFIADDQRGGVDIESITVMVIAKPSIIIISKYSSWEKGVLRIDAEVADEDGDIQEVRFQYSLDNQKWDYIDSIVSAPDMGVYTVHWDTTSVILTADNSVWIKATAIDNDGLVGETVINSSFGIDNAPPKLSNKEQYPSDLTELHEGVFYIQLVAIDEGGSGISDPPLYRYHIGSDTDYFDYGSMEHKNGLWYFEITVEWREYAGKMLYYQIQVSDVTGNIVESEEYSELIDQKLSPVVNITSNPNLWVSGILVIEAEVADADGSIQSVIFQYSLDGEVWNDLGTVASPSDTDTCTLSWGTKTKIPAGDSSVWIKVIAIDNDGLTNEDIIDESFGVDNVAPVTGDDYDGLWHNEDFTIALSIDDGDGSGSANIRYRLNDGEEQSVLEHEQPRIVSEGAKNALEYWGIDRAGNIEKLHHRLSDIKLDKTRPQFSDLTGMRLTSNVLGAYRMRFSIKDILSGLQDYPEIMYVDVTGKTHMEIMANEQDDIWYYDIPEPLEGWRNHGGKKISYSMKCVDLAGNTAQSMRTEIEIEKRLPTIVRVMDSSGGYPQSAGDVITVTVIQESSAAPAERGSYDIGENITDQILYNDGTNGDILSGDNIWTGQYTVMSGDDVHNAPIEAYLYTSDSVVQQVSDTTISIDTIPPRVSSVECPEKVAEGDVNIAININEEGSGMDDMDTAISVQFDIFTRRGERITVPVEGQYKTPNPLGSPAIVWQGTGRIMKEHGDSIAYIVIHGGQDRAGNALLIPDTPIRFEIDVDEDIDEISHDGEDWLREGNSLTVWMIGKPGKQASFDIPGLVAGVPMTEAESGRYQGTYTVQAGDYTVAAKVRCHLDDAEKLANETVSIDALEPEVHSVSVEPGMAMVGDVRVTVRFTENMDATTEPSVT